MGWEPILDGALADTARASVREIADALAAVPPTRELAGDVALFFAYAAGAFDDELSNARYATAIDAFATVTEAGYPSASLFGGLAGAGWTLAHLTDGDAAEEVLAAIDHALLDGITAGQVELDLIRGLVGFGVYFGERLRGGPHPAATSGLGLVVERIGAMAEVTASGATWHTPVDSVPTWQRATAPDGYYNCGVAHGIPGVVAMLAAAAVADIDPEPRARARTLAEDGARWLHAHQLRPNPISRFPSMIAGGRPVDKARTAWCYGDPGVAVTLWNAARRLSLPTADAEALALECIARDPSVGGVRDAALCHGAAGLGHLYNRCFHASGDDRYRDAARAWFERGLAMRTTGEGVAGYRGYTPGPEGADEWRALPGFLDGAAGIGLALLGALGTEPGWDRIMLCDIPCIEDAQPVHVGGT